MKIRKGFISNSSSSSFIISVDSISDKIKVEIDLIEFISNCGEDGDNGLNCIIKNKKELDEYILEQYGYNQTLEDVFEDDDSVKELYDNSLKEIENGMIIISCSVGYDRSTTFETLKNSKQIKFILED